MALSTMDMWFENTRCNPVSEVRQILTNVSADAVAISAPSGENATEFIAPA